MKTGQAKDPKSSTAAAMTVGRTLRDRLCSDPIRILGGTLHEPVITVRERSGKSVSEFWLWLDGKRIDFVLTELKDDRVALCMWVDNEMEAIAVGQKLENILLELGAISVDRPLSSLRQPGR